MINMGNEIKSKKIYFIGIGFSETTDVEVMEVRSLSSEMLGECYYPTLNPTIHHSDMRFWRRSEVDPVLLQELDKEPIYYREWIITEDIFETIKDHSLFDIPSEYLQDKNLRIVEKQLGA